MGLFSLPNEAEYELHGTQNWKKQNCKVRQSAISGDFYEKTPRGITSSKKFNCDDESIFIQKQNQIFILDLCFTVMEENIYLQDHQNVYEIKLKTKNLLTLICTNSLETFIKFFTHMAKYCILTSFKKHYRVGELLGEGTFAKVYNGLNIFSKQNVALKIFQKSSIDSMEDKELIIANEILNLLKLRKFHLSPLIGIFETDDCIILVIQKAEAGNMKDYIKKQQNKYNGDLVRIIMKKILENLKSLHEAGFIHRDIKPQNIFFNSYSVKSSLFLGDFSLTVEKNSSQSNSIARKCSGTLGFIAPEVLHQNNYNQKCDLFSLGCLFYYLHKGQSLFHEKTMKQIYQITCDQNLIQRKIKNLGNLDKKSEDLLEKLLEINPQKRLSAIQALEHQYFDKVEPYKVWTGEEDRTLRQYIFTKFNRFLK